MNKETLRMQFLSGVITESQYKQKLNEQTGTDFIKSEMERLTNEINANPGITDQGKKRRIDNIRFVVYDYLDPNTKGGRSPSSDFQFNDNWWNSIPSDINKWVVEDALLDLLRAAKGDSFGENDIPLNESKTSKSKKSLKENFVGIGMVGNIFDREKTDYEMAFEYFTKGSLSENEEVEEANLNEVKRFEFSFNYNTDEDDVKYIQNLLNKAGVDAMAKAGIDSEEIIVRAFSAKDLTKSKKAIVADGFEIND